MAASYVITMLFGASGDDTGLSLPHGRSGETIRQEATQPTLQDDIDAQLLRGIQTRSTQALNDLVKQYFIPLSRFASHLIGSYDAGEDIAQSVLYRVWELGEKWKPGSSVRAYLFTATRNSALNARKRANVEARYRSDTLLRNSDVLTVEPSTDFGEEELIRNRLRVALEQLTERQQSALRLRYEQQLPAREVAVVLGISTRAVERLLERSINTLRAVLGKE